MFTSAHCPANAVRRVASISLPKTSRDDLCRDAPAGAMPPTRTDTATPAGPCSRRTKARFRYHTQKKEKFTHNEF